ncbi:hypothetical protein EVAR_61873_1 [Eumeta japonica]|uniref:Uncharacterized protein n=1 Tax=Eumeta variegata TaxID=151549 RepID=A0A4C1ZJV3_EUMVA|nr:hypothetical protein EVAR_61873_1 [Eumeta japonica]
MDGRIRTAARASTCALGRAAVVCSCRLVGLRSIRVRTLAIDPMLASTQNADGHFARPANWCDTRASILAIGGTCAPNVGVDSCVRNICAIIFCVMPIHTFGQDMRAMFMSFINMSSLYHHIRKVHQKEENKKLNDTTVELTFPVDNEPDWTIVDNNFSLSNEDDTSGPEWHAARTHCTWPLAPIRPSVPTPPASSSGVNAGDNGDTNGEAYVVDSNDVQVELFDNSDSNIYTVRSDLFLHANAIHSEDSEGGDGPSGACEDGLELVLLPPPALDLDPPPSHLMQEELMYADTVDESSFQVLLLNSDEIN